jgi:micrococcal nuclease
MPCRDHASKIIGALLWAQLAWSGLASEKKAWVKLTDCAYVAGQYNDGDSFRVKSGTNEFILRLYFVDAPETNLRYPERTREQSEYFGATIEETMKAGVEADKAVREILREPFVVWTRWASAAGRSNDRRYYGMAEVNGKDLGDILVSKGLARPKGVAVNLPRGEKARNKFDKLRQLEDEAKAKHAGIWAHSTQSDKGSSVR